MSQCLRLTPFAIEEIGPRQELEDGGAPAFGGDRYRCGTIEGRSGSLSIPGP